MKKIIFLAVLFALAIPQAFARTGYDVLDEIPVQQGGRIKPFQSFAREAVREITGREDFEGVHASPLVWLWMAQPEAWFSKPLIPVSFRPLRQELGLAAAGGRVSPEVLLNHEGFLARVQEASGRQQKKETLSPIEKERLVLYGRAHLFQEIASGLTPGWIAHPDDPRAGWMPLQGLVDEQGLQKLQVFFSAAAIRGVHERALALLEVLRGHPDLPEGVLSAGENFRASLDRLLESKGIQLDRKALQAEVSYNRLRPFSRALFFYLTAVLLLAFHGFKGGSKAVLTAGVLVFAAGFLIHAYGFFLRCVVAGRPPVSNMYESVIWVSWAVAFFSLILFSAYRAPLILTAAGLVASFALTLAQSFPAMLNPAISPLVPVLRSNLWLTVHVLTITLSYGAFALAWGLGHAAVFSYAFKPQAESFQRTASLYVYRAVQIGVILLASGTVLGGVWANYSWGRFWGWDPKETWALIALLGYLAVLHGRFAGWLGAFGLVVGSTVAFLGVVMAWYGVNFVLAAGLHSYGFGGGGAKFVLAAAAADLALVAWAASVYARQSKVDRRVKT